MVDENPSLVCSPARGTARAPRLVRRKRTPSGFYRMGLLGALLVLGGGKLLGSLAAAPAGRSQSIQTILRELQASLSLPYRIVVSIVPVNEKLVSVERSKADPTVFLLRFDEQFLAMLDEEELKAAIAHELGHVWIFTNHPYLHTETLANRIASQAVSMEDLEGLYEKVRSFQEEKSLEAEVQTAGALQPQASEPLD